MVTVITTAESRRNYVWLPTFRSIILALSRCKYKAMMPDFQMKIIIEKCSREFRRFRYNLNFSSRRKKFTGGWKWFLFFLHLHRVDVYEWQVLSCVTWEKDIERRETTSAPICLDCAPFVLLCWIERVTKEAASGRGLYFLPRELDGKVGGGSNELAEKVNLCDGITGERSTIRRRFMGVGER